jgi:hypothetical protein
MEASFVLRKREVSTASPSSSVVETIPNTYLIHNAMAHTIQRLARDPDASKDGTSIPK